MKTLIFALLTAAGVAAADNPSALPAAESAATTPPAINPALPTIFVAGDSTAARGRGERQQGWGVPFADYFDPAKVNVVNRAVGGLSSRTFLTQGHWARVLGMLKSGDIVMMQFGHNDGGAFNDTSRARGSIKGVGEETEEIDNQLTKQHEVVHSYGWYLRRFIADARNRGATPIVCSLVARKTREDGLIARNKDSYAGWAEEVARREGVAFVDLNEIIARRYDALGHDKVMTLFPQTTPDEHTHTNWAGAEVNAECVIAGLKALPDRPLAPFFSAKAADVAPYKPE